MRMSLVFAQNRIALVVPAEGAKVRRLEDLARAGMVAEYPIGVLSRSGSPEQAKAFVDLVLGAAGQAILREHGFAPNAARAERR